MRNIKVAILIGTAILAISGTSEILSSGAPIGSTGAPGELTCGKSGCHQGNNGQNNINTGKGVLTITGQSQIARYQPGEVYNITVTIEEPGIQRFGFSLTALDENNNRAGTLRVTESQRTQIFQGAHQFTGREYMTYRMTGTNPVEPGKGEWTFQWQAPESPAGNITFYAAAVSADNDATHFGDLVYTQTLQSNGDTPYNPTTHPEITVYPNPVHEQMQVQFSQPTFETLTFTIINPAGKIISQLPHNHQSADGLTHTFPISGFPKGLYLLKVASPTFTITKKIILTN